MTRREAATDSEDALIGMFNSSLSLPWGATYTVSRKNIPDIFSCNSRKHCRIFIMFGALVTEKVSNV